MTLGELKDLADAAAHIAAAAGVVVGGIWTYLLFVKNREKFPRAEVANTATILRVNESIRIVRVAISVTNTGKVLLPITHLECRLLQVLPPVGTVEKKLEHPAGLIDEGAQSIKWPMIDQRTWKYRTGEAELEPGEKETLWCDFVVHNAVRAVQIYSFLQNVRKKVIGWRCISELSLESEIAIDQGSLRLGRARGQLLPDQMPFERVPWLKRNPGVRSGETGAQKSDDTHPPDAEPHNNTPQAPNPPED